MVVVAAVAAAVVAAMAVRAVAVPVEVALVVVLARCGGERLVHGPDAADCAASAEMTRSCNKLRQG